MQTISEILTVVFIVLFCFMFLDRYLFGGQLPEICFGRQRRWLARLLRRMASVIDMPPPYPPADMSSLARQTDGLVSRHTYSSGQTPPNPDIIRQDEQPAQNTHTFADPTKDEPVRTPQTLPKLLTDRARMEWTAEDISVLQIPTTPHVFIRPTSPSVPEESQEPTEEENALGCSTADGTADGGQGIGPSEMSWIIALCNGQPVPHDKRQALLRAINNIRGTEIHRSLIESINGSDNRIARFLDDAEREAVGIDA